MFSFQLPPHSVACRTNVKDFLMIVVVGFYSMKKRTATSKNCAAAVLEKQKNTVFPVLSTTEVKLGSFRIELNGRVLLCCVFFCAVKQLLVLWNHKCDKLSDDDTVDTLPHMSIRDWIMINQGL